jgi:hypothetical protein
MGGAGAWHLGLHHPDKWAAVEAGAGFTDTKKYTAGRLTDLTPTQEKTLHIYDAEDYALNAFNVPLVAYAGEDDPAIRCTVAMREALEREGFKFRQDGLNWLTTDLRAIFLIAAKTPHRWHPESKAASDKFINEAVAKRSEPACVRFVTYTTKFNRCGWVTVDALEKHYERAEVDASVSDKGSHLDIKTRNVTRLVLPDQPQGPRLTIDGQRFQLRAHLHSRPSDLVLEKKGAAWTASDIAFSQLDRQLPLRKKHGLQGPIDDAFMEPFLCVRPTGAPNHALTNDGAKARLALFAKEFSKWMRGDVRLKDDAAVTNDDIANQNLILFGDPASNRLTGQIADKLPIRWTKAAITVGSKTFNAADHVLVMIYPNPLNPRRYVVLNSGHTFGEKEFRGTNALLFPRLGDYAVIKLTKSPAGAVTEEVVLAGLFDEQWMLPATPDAKR